MNSSTVDVSIGGVWHTVPAIPVGEHMIAVKGKWLKIAAIHDEDFLETAILDPSIYIDAVRQFRAKGQRADLFTFAERPPVSQPRFDYAMEMESVAAVRTTSFDQWWTGLSQESRKNVRRAEKRGVSVIVKTLDDQLIRDIVDLNNDSPVRQGKAFVHYGKSYEEVKRDQAAFPGRSDYVCAYLGEELIGFLKIAYRGDLASLVQILPKASHHDKRPANAMLAKAVELCAGKGVDYLIYGLFNYGNKDSSLLEFKRRNGFEELLVPRYYVPLSAWGAVSLKLKGHRGMRQMLPSKVIAGVAGIRTRCYNYLGLLRRRSSVG